MCFCKSCMCQSCGMPLSKDPEGGGTTADGAKSTEYCSYCYKQGKFTASCTAQQMQDFVKAKLRELGYGRFLAWLFSRSVPKLKRWRQNS